MSYGWRVVLLAAEGVPNRQIAVEVGMAEEYVGMWRRRFEADRLKVLEDLPRSGRPRKYGHDERLKIVATATSQRPEFDSQWSHRLLAEYLDDLGISASQVGRILADLDIKPHQVRGWLTRKNDPAFWERASRRRPSDRRFPPRCHPPNAVSPAHERPA